MVRTCKIFAAGTLFAGAAMANLLTNGSFETASVGNTLPTGNGVQLNTGSTAMEGWTVTGTNSQGIAWLPNGNSYGVTPQDGTYFLDLTSYSDTTPFDGVSQTISSLAAGNYTLTFYIGVDNASGLYAGPAAVYASAGNQSNVVFINSSMGSGNVWVQETLNFNVATTGPVTVTLQGDSADSRSGEQYVGLDNVDLEVASATPEPAMALPVLLALGGLLLRSRFKQKRPNLAAGPLRSTD